MAEEHQTAAPDLEESVLGDIHPLGDAASVVLGEMEGYDNQEGTQLEGPKSRANMVGAGRGVGVSKGSLNSTTGLD
jgi:hypothetical protein